MKSLRLPCSVDMFQVRTKIQTSNCPVSEYSDCAGWVTLGVWLFMWLMSKDYFHVNLSGLLWIILPGCVGVGVGISSS